MKPRHGEMIKPAELIDIHGAAELSLSAKRLYNALLYNAFGPEMAVEGSDWTISLSELRGTHRSNERIEDSIEALMKTLITVRLPDGKIQRTQLLGGNDMDSPERLRGTLTYSLDKRLVALLKKSTVFGKLELSVIYSFRTKYALALYEAIARRVHLHHIYHEQMTLQEFRDILAVPTRKLRDFSNLYKRAIAPAIDEINEKASFGVNVIPVRTGRHITHVKVGWYRKNAAERRTSFARLNPTRHEVELSG